MGMGATNVMGQQPTSGGMGQITQPLTQPGAQPGGKGGTSTNVPAGKGVTGGPATNTNYPAYNPGANTYGQDPTRFNAQGYLNAYPDLQKAFGNDTAAAQQHYNQFGKAENRTVPGYAQYNPVTANMPQSQNPQSNLNLPQGGFQPNYGMYNNQPPMPQPLNPSQANINYAPQKPMPQQGGMMGGQMDPRAMAQGPGAFDFNNIAKANPNINPSEIIDLQGMGGPAYAQQLAKLQGMGVTGLPNTNPLAAPQAPLRGLPQNAGQMPQAPTQHRMGRRDERQEAQRAMQQFRPGMGRR